MITRKSVAVVAAPLVGTIIIICRPLIGQNDRLQVVPARFPGPHQVTPPHLRSFLQLQSLVDQHMQHPGDFDFLQSSEDNERCHCYKIFFYPAARSRVRRSSLEVVEMCKDEAGEKSRSSSCPKV